jgi:hypothetical protein
MRKKVSALSGLIARAAASALLWFFLLRAGGIGFVVAGVQVLFGTGWAFVALGISAVVASEFIRKGLTARA